MSIKSENYMIVNNTGSNIELIKPMLHEFAKNIDNQLNLPNAIEDVFCIKIIRKDGQTRLLVDFLDN